MLQRRTELALAPAALERAIDELQVGGIPGLQACDFPYYFLQEAWCGKDFRD